MAQESSTQSQEKLAVALFNGTVATTNGVYRISDISIEKARELVAAHGYSSAIGHEATAAILGELLAIPVRMNRVQFHQQVGQKAIVLKMHDRPPEGKILSRQEMDRIGYTLKLMERME